MTDQSFCPCGSGTPFSSCCLPVLNDHRLAATAEMLMRSRYTGFVRKDDKHIMASWHRTTRPRQLNFEDNQVVWLGLEIHQCRGGQATDDHGTVDFTASYLEQGRLCRLRELSQFIKEDGLWYYLRGKCTVAKEKIARNSPCPCGSGLKFKHCCLPK